MTHPEETKSNGLETIDTMGSINIPRDVFEKLYLTPQSQVKGELRKTFANPTPLALAGFIISAFPLSCDLMGWRGAGGMGAASVGAYLFMGGLLQIIASVQEFILGNTFPSVVFGTIGGFWLSFGATLTPFYNAAGAYSKTGDNQELGMKTPMFAASLAFYLTAMAIISFIFLICSIRTNVILFTLFIALTMAFSFLAGAYWNLAQGHIKLAMKLQTGGGALTFALSCMGFYLLFAQLLESVDFPFELPVGDLSTVIKGRSQMLKDKKDRAHQE